MKKPLFNRVVIAGVGLMGGSLGLILKKKKLAQEVVGLARRERTIQEALSLRAIDRGTLSLPKALSQAELVVLAGPVSSTPELLKRMLPYLPQGCLVTDIGSTKKQLLRQVKRLLPVCSWFHFVGSHPMAGSEQAGVLKARPDLYAGALCLLVRASWSDPRAIKRLEEFWVAVGCQPIRVVTPEQHDAWTAVASHLPHAAAVCLVNVLAERSARSPQVKEVAATGFRDMTRIASGPPEMWADILLANGEEVSRAIQGLQGKLKQILVLLQRGSRTALIQEFDKAGKFRRLMEDARFERKNR